MPPVAVRQMEPDWSSTETAASRRVRAEMPSAFQASLNRARRMSRLATSRRLRPPAWRAALSSRSEEQTSELQSLMRISYAVFCLKKKKYDIYTLIIHSSDH